jgi:hypothetical protein
MARDMTLFFDEDGHAYHFHASEDNATMRVSLPTGSQRARIVFNESRAPLWPPAA